MHLKFDLKGSTYKRRASKREREKSKPTFKDLDFLSDVPEGLILDQDTYGALVKTLQRDCLVRRRKRRNCTNSFSESKIVKFLLIIDQLKGMIKQREREKDAFGSLLTPKSCYMCLK